MSIKILNVAAWARSNERVPVTLPRELEDYIPEVEEFYKVGNHALFGQSGHVNTMEPVHRNLCTGLAVRFWNAI